jgi:hypothetical protein
MLRQTGRVRFSSPTGWEATDSVWVGGVCGSFSDNNPHSCGSFRMPLKVEEVIKLLESEHIAILRQTGQPSPLQSPSSASPPCRHRPASWEPTPTELPPAGEPEFMQRGVPPAVPPQRAERLLRPRRDRHLLPRRSREEQRELRIWWSRGPSDRLLRSLTSGESAETGINGQTQPTSGVVGRAWWEELA